MNIAAISALVDLTSAIITIATKLQAASQTIQKAQAEGWADDDPRWDEAWKTADKALQDALARLK